MSRHVVFRAGGGRYGLPLEAAREVVPPPRAYTRVPRAPAAVRGVMNVRGRIVTVVDFASLLQLQPGAVDAGAARVLVLEARKRDLGLLVEEVAGIADIERERASPTGPPMCVGLGREGGEPVTLLGPDGLLSAILGAFETTG